MLSDLIQHDPRCPVVELRIGAISGPLGSIILPGQRSDGLGSLAQDTEIPSARMVSSITLKNTL